MREKDPDILFARSGDNLRLEVLAAAALLRVEGAARRALLVLAIPQKYPHGLDEPRFHRSFPIDCLQASSMFMDTRTRSSSCCGNGRTTKPFDMPVKNR